MQTASFVARFVMLAILSPLVKEIRPDSDIPLGPLLYSEKGRALRGDNALVQIVNELDNGLPPSDESEYETEEYGLGPKPPRPHQAQLHVDKNPKYSAFAKAVLFAKAFFQRLDLVADAFWNDLEILHRKDQEALENFARVYAILQKIQRIRLNAKDQLLFRAFARVLSGVLAMEKTLDAHMPRETDLQEMERILIELDETEFFEGIGSLIWRLRQVQFYTQKTSVFLKTLLNTNLESPESRRQFRALQDTIIHIMGIVGELMLELAAPARHGVFIGDDVLDAGDNAADQLENLGTVAQIGKTTLTEAVGGVFSERLLTQVPQLAIAMHNLIRRLRRKPEFMKGIIYVNISALNVHLRTMRWVEQNGGWVELDLPRKNGSSSFFTVDSVSIATENAFGLDPPMARLVSEELFSVLKDWDPAAPEECRWTKWANWSGCSITCGAGGLRYKRRMCLSMDGIICEGKDAEESVCAGNVSCEPYIPVVCPDEPVPEISQSMPANASLPNMYRCSCEYVPWLCDNGGYCIEKMEANNRGQLFKRVSCWCNFGFYGPYCEGRFLLFIIGWFIASAVGAILGLLCCYILRTFRDKEESSQKPPYVESPPGYYLKDSASETDEWDYQETHGHPNQLMQQRQIDRELSQTFMPEQTNILSPTTQKGQDPQRHVSSPAPQNQASEEHHDSRNYASNLNQQEDYDAQAPVQSDESFPQIRLDLDDDEEDDIWKSETTSAVSEGQSFILEEVKTVIEEETICSKPKSEKKAKPEQEPELEPKPEPEPTPESKPEPEPQQQVPPKISQAQSYDVDYNICSPRRLCDIPRVSYLATKDFLSPCYSPRMMKTPSMDPCLSFECSSSFLGDMVCYSPRYDCSNMMNFDSPRFINTVPPIMCGTANCWFLPRPEIIPAHMNFNQHCPAIVCPVPPIRSCIANCGIYSSSDGNLDFVPSLARDGLSRTCDDRISKVYDSCEKPCFANRLDYTCSAFRDSCSEMAYCRQTGLSFNQLPMKRLIEERVTTGGELGSIVTLRKCNSMEVMSGCAETTMYTEEERQVLSERAAGAGCRVSSIGSCSAGVGSNPLLHSSGKRFGRYADCSSNLFSGSSTLTRFNYFNECTPDSVEQQEVLSEIMKSERKKMAVELPVIQRVCRIIPGINSTCQVESNKVSSDERDFKRRGQKPSTIERRIELLSCLPKEKTSFPSLVEKRKAASAGKLPKAPEETKDLTIYRSFSSQPSPKATQSSLNQQEPLSDEEQAAKQIQKDDLDRAIRGFVDSIEQGAEMMSQVTRQLNSIEQGAEMMSQVTRQLNSIEQGAEMMSQITRELNSIEQGAEMMSQVTSELNTMNSPDRDVEKSPSRVEEVSNKSNWLTTIARFLGIKTKTEQNEDNPMVQPPMEPVAFTPGRRLDRFSGVNVGPIYRGPNYMFTRGLGGGTPIRQPPRPLAERTEFNVQADLSNGSLILTPRTNYNQQVTAVNQEPRYLSSYGGPLKTQDVPASREPSPRSIEETTEINVQAELSNGSLILTPRMSYNQQATTVVNQEPRYFSSAGGPPIQQQSNSFANQQVSSVNQEPRYLSSSGGPSKKQDILVSRQPSLKYLAERREISTKHAYKGPPVDLTPTTSGSEDVIIIHEGPEFKRKSSDKKEAKKNVSKSSLSAEWKPSKRSLEQIKSDLFIRSCTKSQERVGKCTEVSSKLENRLHMQDRKSGKKKTKTKKSDKGSKEEKKEKKKKEKKKKKKKTGPSLYGFKEEQPMGSQSESNAYTSEEERVLRVVNPPNTLGQMGVRTETGFQNAEGTSNYGTNMMVGGPAGSPYFPTNTFQTTGFRGPCGTENSFKNCKGIPFCVPYCRQRLSVTGCGTTGTRFQNTDYSSTADRTCRTTRAPCGSACYYSATTAEAAGTRLQKADEGSIVVGVPSGSRQGKGSRVKSDIQSVASTTSTVSSLSQSQVSEYMSVSGSQMSLIGSQMSVIGSQMSVIGSQMSMSAQNVKVPLPTVVITRPSRPSGAKAPYEDEKARISAKYTQESKKERSSSSTRRRSSSSKRRSPSSSKRRSPGSSKRRRQSSSPRRNSEKKDKRAGSREQKANSNSNVKRKSRKTSPSHEWVTDYLEQTQFQPSEISTYAIAQPQFPQYQFVTGDVADVTAQTQNADCSLQQQRQSVQRSLPRYQSVAVDTRQHQLPPYQFVTDQIAQTRLPPYQIVTGVTAQTQLQNSDSSSQEPRQRRESAQRGSSRYQVVANEKPQLRFRISENGLQEQGEMGESAERISPLYQTVTNEIAQTQFSPYQLATGDTMHTQFQPYQYVSNDTGQTQLQHSDYSIQEQGKGRKSAIRSSTPFQIVTDETEQVQFPSDQVVSDQTGRKQRRKSARRSSTPFQIVTDETEQTGFPSYQVVTDKMGQTHLVPYQSATDKTGQTEFPSYQIVTDDTGQTQLVPYQSLTDETDDTEFPPYQIVTDEYGQTQIVPYQYVMDETGQILLQYADDSSPGEKPVDIIVPAVNIIRPSRPKTPLPYLKAKAKLPDIEDIHYRAKHAGRSKHPTVEKEKLDWAKLLSASKLSDRRNAINLDWRYLAVENTELDNPEGKSKGERSKRKKDDHEDTRDHKKRHDDRKKRDGDRSKHADDRKTRHDGHKTHHNDHKTSHDTSRSNSKHKLKHKEDKSHKKPESGRRNRNLNSSAFSEFQRGTNSGAPSKRQDRDSDPQVVAIDKEELFNKSPRAPDRCSIDRDQQSMSRETQMKINLGNSNSTKKSRFTSSTADKLTPGGDVRFAYPSSTRFDAPPSRTLNASKHRGVYMQSFQSAWSSYPSNGERKVHGFASFSMTSHSKQQREFSGFS